MPRFYGKYRGQIANNVDPMLRGRVQVTVPAVLGDGRMSWAEPCVPYAGSGVGLFAVPPVGANVWVEFEAGDPERPILAGCFWGAGEAPASPAVPEIKMWKTDAISVTLSDLPGAGGLTIEVGSPAAAVPMKITFTSSGIELSTGSSSIKLSAASVSVNNGALEVI
jgi:Type VI secretion system/phage-baseplate injector OB domain